MFTNSGSVLYSVRYELAIASRNRIVVPARQGYIGWRNRFLGVDSCFGIFKQSMGLEPSRNRIVVSAGQNRKLKSRYGARNRFQEPSLELSSQATKAGGPVRQPYAYLVPIAPIARLKFLSQATKAGGIYSFFLE